MKRVFAILSLAVLAAWASPASAVVIFTDPGGTITRASPFLTVMGDVTGFFNVKLRFKTDGNGGIDACDGSAKSDCLNVYVNGDPIAARQDLSVPNALTSFGSTAIGADNQMITLLFEGIFSCGCESIVISKIKVTSRALLTPSGIVLVPEPATFALFGFGLAGFGYMRRRRSI